jgi:hypothetical protein
MNIAEILKNSPVGTKLYSPIFGDVTFKGINSLYIEVLDLRNIVREFYHDGRFYMNGECMLFPSRENRDWSKFDVKTISLKFKVGDIIHRSGYTDFMVVAIEEDRYRLQNGFCLRFVDQHEWKIAKFDIKSLKPFDKVLVRDDDKSEWYCEFYSHYRNNTSHYKYACTSSAFYQCIPYNDRTKHLVGTTEDCPEYYKTW